MSNNKERLLTFGNEKALRKQGSIPPSAPTKALKEVGGEYQLFENIAISCLQFIEHEPFYASLRISSAKRNGAGLRVSISGRDGKAACFLTNVQQVDDLIARLEILKRAQFGEQVGVAK